MSHSPITFIVIFVNIQWANQEAIDKTLGANLWHGTSPCQIHTPSPTYKTLHAVQEPQPIKRLPISPQSIVILWVLNSSSQLPLKLPGHGTQMAVELVQKFGRRITLVTEDSRETVFLFQRLSIAFQWGNAVSFLSMFTATD